MRRSYFIALFIGFMATALIGYTSIKAGILPVALVNRSFISARDFNESVASVEHYYREIAKEANAALPAESKVSTLEIKRATLDKLIENALIEDALEARMTREELRGIVSRKIGALAEVKTPEFSNSVAALYGITANRFEELVLVPKAKEEVLAGEFEQEGEIFEHGVTNLRSGAIVRILVPGLHWVDGGVIVRGR